MPQALFWLTGIAFGICVYQQAAMLKLKRKILLIIVITFLPEVDQAAPVAPYTYEWGCNLGGRIYWNWLGTSNNSGGILYYHFNPSGSYTDWASDYAFRTGYECYKFNGTSPGNLSCSVSGTMGVRGYITNLPINCDLDDICIIIVFGILLSTIALIHLRKKERHVI